VTLKAELPSRKMALPRLAPVPSVMPEVEVTFKPANVGLLLVAISWTVPIEIVEEPLSVV